MRRVLITGGAGFIGTHLAESLIRRDDIHIVLFDNFRRDSLNYVPQLKEHKNISIVHGDIKEAESVSSAMAGVDLVFHLAAIAGVSSYYTESLNTLQTNILGTVNVLEQAAKAGVNGFIHFSTSEVYGSDAMWVSEERACSIGSPDESRWVYAVSKLSGENFTLRYGETYGFKPVVIRPFNIYGPRQTGEGAISNFCRAVVANKPMTVYDDGSAIRAWCYVDDIVRVLNGFVDKVPTEERIFNIGNPREVETTLGLARRMARLVPGSEIEFKTSGHTEVRARIPSIQRARKVLNYEPVVDLDQGLLETIEWFRKTADKAESVQTTKR